MKQHSTKIFRDIVNGLGAFIQSQFMAQPVVSSSQAGNDVIKVHILNVGINLFILCGVLTVL